jgi:hypothetical protein
MMKLRSAMLVLAMPRHVPDVIKRGQNVVDMMGKNQAMFPNPSPPLTEATANLQALDAAETQAKTKAKGTAEIRDLKLAEVVLTMNHLKSYVQQVVDGNPAQAASIAQSAGMDLRKPGTRSKQEFEVRQGDTTGTVELIAKSSGRAAYEWQVSADQKSWATVAITVKARYTARGLVAGTNYSFRYRVITAAGEGEWSQVVSMIVK